VPLFWPLLPQIVGAILGSSFLYATIPNSGASSLGSNTLAAGVSTGNAIMGEIVCKAAADAWPKGAA
jgi:hypothetical protein